MKRAQQRLKKNSRSRVIVTMRC